MAEADGADRSEAATPKRLERAHDAGQGALSREAAPFAVLAVGALLLGIAAPAAARALAGRLAAFLALSPGTPPMTAMRGALWTALLMTAPFLLACALAGTLAALVQTGGRLNLTALKPDLARLDPRRGLARIVSATALLEGGKAALKFFAAGAAAWLVLAGALPLLPAALLWDPVTLLDHAAGEVLRLTLALVAAQGVLAGFDIMRARLAFGRSTRMTRQEVRDEFKEMEGDPQIKARIRRLRLQRARRRMMQYVPKAAVVVTNPTHYAVALAYQRGSTAAPKVVAKGMDTLAERIRELAREHNVPVVSNPPLARALHALELDCEIPRELYQTVAEVIAYVWRLRGRNR